MDLLRSIDWGMVRELASFTSQHVWVALVVYTAAELLIAIPFLTLYVLWRRPEPVSHKHGNQKAALMAVMTMALALAAKALVNFLWFRPRPFVSHPELATLPLRVDPASFPSGHTVIAFAIAFSLWHSGLKKAALWLFMVAACIGLARVAAGVHYPSDVAGGILIAFAASWYLHREASSIRRFLPNE